MLQADTAKTQERDDDLRALVVGFALVMAATVATLCFSADEVLLGRFLSGFGGTSCVLLLARLCLPTCSAALVWWATVLMIAAASFALSIAADDDSAAAAGPAVALVLGELSAGAAIAGNRISRGLCLSGLVPAALCLWAGYEGLPG